MKMDPPQTSSVQAGIICNKMGNCRILMRIHCKDKVLRDCRIVWWFH